MALIMPLPVECWISYGSNFPTYVRAMAGGAERSALAFSNSVTQKVRSPAIPFPTFTGALTLKLLVASATTTGNVQFRSEVEAVTSLDALNTNTSNSFATANSSGSVAIAGTTYNPKEISITLTNDDGIAAGDYVIFTLDRDVSVGSNVADIVYFYSAGIFDAS